MSDATFWIVFWTLIPAAAVLGGAMGKLVNGFVHNQTARRLMLAQVWVTMPLLTMTILLSILLILSVGLLIMLISFFLLGLVIGLAPWTDVYSHR